VTHIAIGFSGHSKSVSCGGSTVRISKLSGKDEYIKARLEEGYSFRLLSRELGVSHQALINYVNGLDGRRRKKRKGVSFRKPPTPKDWAERHGISIYAVRDWLREGRIKGRKVGYRWVIIK
jgi:hypothetical protein